MDTGRAETLQVALDLGDPCPAPSSCHSGYCVDDVCCDSACGGGDSNDCQACSMAAGASVSGICEGLTGISCDDGAFCNGTELCAAGTCGSSSGDPCAANLGDADTDCSESCDEATDDCTANDPDASSCDDGDACNQSDSCSSGACTGADPVTCSAQDECHGAGPCDSTTGLCDAPPLPDDTPCAGGTCQDGVCASGSDLDNASGCGCRVPSGGKPSPWRAIGWLGLGLIWVRRRSAGPGSPAARLPWGSGIPIQGLTTCVLHRGNH
ncbi:MAG: hypothetical protein DRI90_20560 [Deltaproteobacteria bacterium]|nr:MAG: hypothetical protein DRI90_20560 [Deltaproteobacteria bacterium]